MSQFEHITTDVTVAAYISSSSVFAALLNEVRELSRKKSDAAMSISKVNLVNSVLDDLLLILREEPEGKYLRRLESDDLPQVSDALLMMAQFNAALEKFKSRYYRFTKVNYSHHHYWITEERVAVWENANDVVQMDSDGI